MTPTAIALPKEPLQEPANQAAMAESKSQCTTARQHTMMNQGTD
jgi:hypothetical protein